MDYRSQRSGCPARQPRPAARALGLTIAVKDAVTELGGTVEALARGELGGAEFIVELPLLGASK